MATPNHRHSLKYYTKWFKALFFNSHRRSRAVFCAVLAVGYLCLAFVYLETDMDRKIRPQSVLMHQTPSGQKGDEETTALTAYSLLRRDRSGAAILDMLLAHAYCSAKSLHYGGVCLEINSQYPHQPAHEELLKSLGLEKIFLPFVPCPPRSNSSAIVLPRDIYFAPDTAIWTEEWLSEMRLFRRPMPPMVGQRPVQVAVHIRRGDVSLCMKEESFRYIPNLHYQKILENMVLPQHPNANITIFSESENADDWHGLSKYHLALDVNPVDVWKSMVDADVLVMSKSSFSLVPAVFSAGEVIYTPFWHNPLSTWNIVPESIVAESQREVNRLQQRCHLQ
jgi:hypothetical protein